MNGRRGGTNLGRTPSSLTGRSRRRDYADRVSIAEAKKEGREYIETFDSVEWLKKEGTLGEDGEYKKTNDIPRLELGHKMRSIESEIGFRIAKVLGVDDVILFTDVIAGDNNSVDRVDMDITIRKKFNGYYETIAHEWISVDVRGKDFESILREVDRKVFRPSLRRVEKMLREQKQKER